MNIRNLFPVAAIAMASLISCSKGHNPAPGTGDGGDGGGGSKFHVTITTLAGKLDDKGNAEDGNGANARFWNPTKMVFDSRNNTLYIADGSVVRSMDAQNNVRTYVPLNAIGNSFVDILDMDVAPGTGGTLYVTTDDNDLWKIEPSGSGSHATLLAGNEYGGNDVGDLHTGDHFNLATGVATGSNGDIYFLNQTYNTVHRITLSSPTDGTVTSFAGKPYFLDAPGQPYAFADGKGENATFSGGDNDMAADNNGNLYVADRDNEEVRKITPDGTVTSLFKYMEGLGVDQDGPVSTAHSNSVTQVASTPDGSMIFFASYGNRSYNSSSLRVVRPGNDVTTLATAGLNYGDGEGSKAGIGGIGGMATSPDGKVVYFSEPGRKVIRKVVLQ